MIARQKKGLFKKILHTLIPGWKIFTQLSEILHKPDLRGLPLFPTLDSGNWPGG